MRVLVNIEHPAHVHFFKNFIWQMRSRGHEILISAFDKEVTLQLLKTYAFEYDLCGRQGNSFFASIKQVLQRDLRVYHLARKFKPDIIIGIGDIVGAHVSALTKASSIVFTDTEHARLGNMLTFPFANVICTPICFKQNLGGKQVRYEGYHELAYLHPNYFKPDPSVLNELGIDIDERFIIVRFVSWEATHDIGHRGFSHARELISRLEPYGRVLITAEGELDSDVRGYTMTAPPEKIHDLLYYATLYVGEGATMATEAAVLGTPSIYTSSLAGTMGNFIELEDKYGLAYSFRSQEATIEKASQLLQMRNLKELWSAKRGKLLADKIDVTRFMVNFVENYPQSYEEYRKALNANAGY